MGRKATEKTLLIDTLMKDTNATTPMENEIANQQYRIFFANFEFLA